MNTVRDLTPEKLVDIGFKEDPSSPRWFLKGHLRIVLKDFEGGIRLISYQGQAGATPPVWDMELSGSTPLPVLAAILQAA